MIIKTIIIIMVAVALTLESYKLNKIWREYGIYSSKRGYIRTPNW